MGLGCWCLISAGVTFAYLQRPRILVLVLLPVQQKEAEGRSVKMCARPVECACVFPTHTLGCC